tara:strand:- start:13450 stop:13812 length:363 start_codon:yes stop_codon:yes gene_type:complete
MSELTSEKARKQFPNMRLTRAMELTRIDDLSKKDRPAAIKRLNALLSKGSQSGGLNDAETKTANQFYKKLQKKLKAGSTKGRGGGAMLDLGRMATGTDLPPMKKMRDGGVVRGSQFKGTF